MFQTCISMHKSCIIKSLQQSSSFKEAVWNIGRWLPNLVGAEVDDCPEQSRLISNLQKLASLQRMFPAHKYCVFQGKFLDILKEVAGMYLGIVARARASKTRNQNHPNVSSVNQKQWDERYRDMSLVEPHVDCHVPRTTALYSLDLRWLLSESLVERPRENPIWRQGWMELPEPIVSLASFKDWFFDLDGK